MLGFPALKCTDTVHGKRPYAAKRFMASLARRQFLRNHFRLCSVLWIVAFVPAVAHGVELKKKTIDAFDTYTRLTEERIDKEKDGPGFLYIDQLPEGQRKALQQRMAAGEVIINRMKTLEQGKEIEVPDGLIHHWRAIVFVPARTWPRRSRWCRTTTITNGSIPPTWCARNCSAATAMISTSFIGCGGKK